MASPLGAPLSSPHLPAPVSTHPRRSLISRVAHVLPSVVPPYSPCSPEGCSAVGHSHGARVSCDKRGASQGPLIASPCGASASLVACPLHSPCGTPPRLCWWLAFLAPHFPSHLPPPSSLSLLHCCAGVPTHLNSASRSLFEVSKKNLTAADVY